MATYKARASTGSGGFKEVPYTIRDTEMKECPVSFIEQWALELVQQIAAAQHVKDATGAVLYGPDSGKWDARYFDAVRLIQIEDIKVQNAEFEATRR